MVSFDLVYRLFPDLSPDSKIYPEQIHSTRYDLSLAWVARPHFTILETDFGIGAHFLSIVHHWLADPHASERLHIVALTSRGLTQSELALAWDALDCPDAWHPLMSALIDQWPMALPGIHRMDFFDGRLTLTLALGQPAVMLSRLCMVADIAYIDNLSTENNSKRMLQALLPLMTTGGIIEVSQPSLGFKETAQALGFISNSESQAPVWVAQYLPRYQRRVEPYAYPSVVERSIAIVGRGLSGANIASAFAKRGWHVLVISEDMPNRGHRSAALTPRISADDDPLARLSRAGVLRSRIRWLDLGDDCIRPTGALYQQTSTRKTSMKDTLKKCSLPSEWVQYLSETQVRAKTRGVCQGDALWFPQACVVSPDRLCDKLLDHPNITVLEHSVSRIESIQDRWTLYDRDDQVLVADYPYLVLANSVGAYSLLQRSRLLSEAITRRFETTRPVAGQVNYYNYRGPEYIVSSDHYLLPPDAQGWVTLGGTYDDDLTHPQIRPQGDVLNKQAVCQWWRDPTLTQSPSVGAWAGWRLTTNNHLPFLQTLSPSLWMAIAYGARGLSWSALFADILAAHFNREPLPIERDLLMRINILL